MKVKSFFIFPLISLVFTTISFAENFYLVRTSGTRSSGASSVAGSYPIASDFALNNCYGTINSAINAMSGGEHVWVYDGTYSLSAVIPNGTGKTNHTVIRALNDWAVNLTSFSDQWSRSYIIVRGFKTIDGIGFGKSHHIKIIRCSASSAEPAGFWFQGTDGVVGEYGVFEECYVYKGGLRYAFQFGTSSETTRYCVARKCLVRWDYRVTANMPYAMFATYNGSDTYWFNCIGVDATDYISSNYVYRGLKGFFTPNGAPGYYVTGGIILNSYGGGGAYIEDGRLNSIKDTIFYNIQGDGINEGAYDDWAYFLRDQSATATLSNMTIGAVALSSNTEYTAAALRYQNGSGTRTLKNSIIFNNTLDSGDYADEYSSSASYVNWYGNTGGRNKSSGNGTSPQTYNPQSNGLTYLIKIDSGSNLSQNGESGGRIGAQVIWQIGQAATNAEEVGGPPIDRLSAKYYGESGWNVEQENTTRLWPLGDDSGSMENAARTDCASVSYSSGTLWSGSPAINGNRGFAALPGDAPLFRYVAYYLQGTYTIKNIADAYKDIYGLSPAPKGMEPLSPTGLRIIQSN